MAAMKKPVETTYADLAENDVIVDRNGNEWLALDVIADGHAGNTTVVAFWLAEPVGKVRKHRMSKPAGDAVTVLREPTRDEALTDAEAAIDAGPAKVAEPVTEAEAVAVVAEVLGGETIATETADHEAARNLARAGGPALSLPEFSEFTDPEMRSHLYLVHGVYAHDVKTRKALGTMHDELHTTEAGQHTPHNHDGEFPA